MDEEKVKALAANVQELLSSYERQMQLYRQLASQCLYALEGKFTPDKRQRLIAALRGLANTGESK